jgi:hypothetical protein
MFFKTVTVSDLKAHSGEVLGDVQGASVLQVVHRGSAIKVVMTQEHYLALLGRLAAYEAQFGKTVPHVSADKMLEQVKTVVREAMGDTAPAAKARKREASNS